VVRPSPYKHPQDISSSPAIVEPFVETPRRGSYSRARSWTEATSNLDAASEARITDALQRLRSGRTTIIIAHRLSTIAQADQIAVVEDGRIVESGTPAGLRARGGRFAKLFDRWVAGAA